VNPKPGITTTSIPNGNAGTPYNATVDAAGGTGSLVWSGSLPYWMAIDPASGALTGIPPAGGDASASVSVTDANGVTASRSLSLTIASQGSNGASSPLPALTSACPLPGATAGVTYSQPQTAAGGTPPYQFFVSGLPTGLTYSSTSGITGTATAGGTVSVLIEVIDARGNSAAATCSLTVAPPSPLSVSGTTPNGTAGQSYSGSFSVSGGIPPFAWSVASGTLPPGISLDPAGGTLSGIPTTPGAYTFLAKVTDLSQTSTSLSATINIAGALQITTPPSLPDATAGSSYRQSLAASGASGAVVWSMVSGALPDGLTLDPTGAISGSATQAGPFQITVQAADVTGQRTQQQFALTVNLPPVPRVTITGLTGTVSPSQQLTASVTIASAYPLDITGQLALTVAADASVGLVDPAVQFASGGNTVTFRIPANSLQAVFTQTPSFQTGTVAGTLKLDVALQAGGISAPITPSAAITGQIPKLPPVIVGTPTAARTNGGIQLTIIAFASSREITGATFHFLGTNVQPADLSVSLSSLTGGWFNDPQSAAFGSALRIVQPFVVQGTASQITGSHDYADEFGGKFDSG
jgi:hypothetical protein